MRRSHIIWWTCLGLTAVTLVVGGTGGSWLLYSVKRSYIEIQAAANAQQAVRIAGVLEQELAAGDTVQEVLERLQRSLITAPHDEAGFMCLLGGQGQVLCHPDPKAIGMEMAEAQIVPLHQGLVQTMRQRLASREPGSGFLSNQGFMSETHIIYQQPVNGADWWVSVHANFDLIGERVARLRRRIIRTSVPLMIALIVAGTAVTHWIRRRYEHRIEQLNAGLETRVQERTSELKAVQERYYELFNAAPVAIFVCQPDGTIVEANHGCTLLSGLALGKLIGRNLGDFVAKTDDAGGGPFASPIPNPRVLAWKGTLYRADGAERELQILESPVPGQPRDLVQAIVMDVTEQLRMQEALRQSQRMEAFGQLAGGIAHDFNNLLTAILGYADMARSKMDATSPAGDCLNQVLAAGNRAKSLTAQILAFSRKQPMELRLVNLNEIVNGITKLLQRIIGERIRIQLVLADDLHPVMVDPAQIEQVILNLAVNARDAMADGGTLTIQTANLRRTGDNAYMALSVSDTGCGIPEELRERIFEPFFTTKEQGRGTGLGLATVMGIVKQHGGEIELESRVSQGTTFKIILPVARNSTTVPLPAEEHGPVRGGHERILLIEDDPAVLDLTRFRLQQLGYGVVAAAHGEQALTLLEQHAGSIQMVLTDVVMPGPNIETLTAQIKALCPGIPIAYMTGYTDEIAFRERARSEGIPVFQKPFSLETLANGIRQTLDAPPTSNHSEGGRIEPGCV